MAASKPVLPRSPFAVGTHGAAQNRDLEREIQRIAQDVGKLRDGRLGGVLALPDAPSGGTWAQGDIVRHSDPTKTISASTTWVVWGWQYVDEGAGTLTWAELRFWDAMAAGGGGSFAASSMTATNTGTDGVGVYVGNSAGELTFRKIKGDGTNITVTTSGAQVRIDYVGAGGGFTAASQTATSTGTGVATYVGNAAGELTFRKVQAGSGISVTTSAGAIRIAATASGGFTGASQTATHTGTGEDVYVGNAAGELTFRKLQEGTGISLTVSGGAIRIAATATGGGGNSITTTEYASKPSGTVAGTLYLPKSLGARLEVATGTGWLPWGPLYPLTEPPPPASFTWHNATSSITVTQVYGALCFSSVGLSSSAPKFFYKPATGNINGHKVTALIQSPHIAEGSTLFGIFVDNGAGTSRGLYVQGVAGGNQFDVLAGNHTSISAAAPSTPAASFNRDYHWGGQLWLQIEHDASRRHYRISNNGFHWLTIGSITNSDGIATLVNTGFVFQPFSALVQPIFTVLSWKEN